MNDEDSDWISSAAAIDYVERTQKCYREKAAALVKQAADDLKLRSRTVNSSRRWIKAIDNGRTVFYSDNGSGIEYFREDLVKLWPEDQKGATRPAPPQIESNTTPRCDGPISSGIRLAIADLWPGGIPVGLRAKDRDNQILECLRRNEKSVPANISRAVQRVLKRERDK